MHVNKQAFRELLLTNPLVSNLTAKRLSREAAHAIRGLDHDSVFSFSELDRLDRLLDRVFHVSMF